MLDFTDDGEILEGAAGPTDAAAFEAPGPYWNTVNSQGADWSPAAVNPAAGSWTDVLKYGLARTIDAKVRPIQPQNVAPVITPQPRLGGLAANAQQYEGMRKMLFLGAAALALFWLARKAA